MSEPIPFGSRRLGAGQPVAVIAEIGINHEGDVAACARMVEAAAHAGADAIKLQTIDADENYVEGTESHRLFSTAGLSREETGEMFALARRLGMEPFTTAGDAATLDWVERLAPAAHKISSGLLTNLPLVRRAARTGRTVLLSTGMAEIADIDEAIDVVHGANAPFGLFQCTSLYPAPLGTLNLAGIDWLADRYAAPAGFSDHSLGIEAAALSVAAGACMIEKHFSTDPSRSGFDHGISLDGAGMAALVAKVRLAEQMYGVAEKALTDAERAKRAVMHRIVVARRHIGAGETLSEESVGLKRPLPGSRGLAPRHFDSILGRKTVRAIGRDEPIMLDAVE